MYIPIKRTTSLNFLCSDCVRGTQVEWTATMDFSSNTTTTELELPAAATGMVLLVASNDGDDSAMEWFIPSTDPNVFVKHATPLTLGDACPDSNHQHVDWLTLYSPRVTLWPVVFQNDTTVATVYGCTNSTIVTHMGTVVLHSDNVSSSNATLAPNATSVPSLAPSS